MIRSLLLFFMMTGFSSFSSPPPEYLNDADLLSVHPVPQKVTELTIPHINAQAALVIDESSGTILFERDSDKRLPVASLTKIMTAIIILEENSLSETVNGTLNPLDIEGAKIWWRQGEQINLLDALNALLIHSGNDVALALAIHNAGSVEAFVEKMNKKAIDLGLKDTHFTNPVGFDDDDGNHYSTAHDLAFMTLYALKKDTFREIVKTRSKTIHSLDGQFSHTLTSTNKLLGSYLQITGVKTGTTDLAGECLIAMQPVPRKNTNIITVMLNSQDRFQETKVLLENISKNIIW